MGRRIKLDGWGYGLYRSFRVADWAFFVEYKDIPLQANIG